VKVDKGKGEGKMTLMMMMMMTEMDIETSVYYVHLTRLIAREDFIKFTRREITKTYKLCEGFDWVHLVQQRVR
jgi:hypothetical protein